ncbi:hypothetical protein ACIQLJ_10395 [Microbacterium sp. NPDC091313]
MAVAGGILLYLGRNQWFYFDEWSFLQSPLAELWQGHGGHWSTVALLIWVGIQGIFGLGSYLPFLAVAVIAHLSVAHLTWRILRRIGVNDLIATASVAVFLLLGAASENLFWAFQFGFMGAIALALGAALLSLTPTLSRRRAVSIATLLLLASATSGTALPFFAAVAIILWQRQGLRRTAAIMSAPVVVYSAWYLFVAGENSNEALKATGIDVLLVPQFAGAMIVDGIDAASPVPFAGIVIAAAVAWFAFRTLNRRQDDSAAVALALLGAGLIFALLTGYSRWHTGIESAASGRYVYVIALTFLPVAALMLSRATPRTPGRALAVALMGVIGVFNVGILVQDAREESSREAFVQGAISAGVALADEYPEIDTAESPEPEFFPFPLSLAIDLSETDGLQLTAFNEEERLTALAGVGLTVRPVDEVSSCSPLAAGTILTAGDILQTPAAATVQVAAIEPEVSQGHSRSVTLSAGATELGLVDGTALTVTQTAPSAQLCTEGATQ